jgi:hypothetical protein
VDLTRASGSSTLSPRVTWRPGLVLVKPDTVLAWHRRGFRLFWTWKSRSRRGRPTAAVEVRGLIRRMATVNPLWGAPRIHGELQTLGIRVSQATVAKYLPRSGIRIPGDAVIATDKIRPLRYTVGRMLSVRAVSPLLQRSSVIHPNV